MTAMHQARPAEPRSAPGTAASSFLPDNFALQRCLQSFDDTPSGQHEHSRERDGPHLIARRAPGLRVFRALPAGRKLHLLLHGHGRAVIELGGLLPERHYRTGQAAQPFLRADREGRGLLRLSLDGRTALTIQPVV